MNKVLTSQWGRIAVRILGLSVALVALAQGVNALVNPPFVPLNPTAVTLTQYDLVRHYSSVKYRVANTATWRDARARALAASLDTLLPLPNSISCPLIPGAYTRAVFQYASSVVTIETDQCVGVSRLVNGELQDDRWIYNRHSLLAWKVLARGQF